MEGFLKEVAVTAPALHAGLQALRRGVRQRCPPGHHLHLLPAGAAAGLGVGPGAGALLRELRGRWGPGRGSPGSLTCLPVEVSQPTPFPSRAAPGDLQLSGPGQERVGGGCPLCGEPAPGGVVRDLRPRALPPAVSAGRAPPGVGVARGPSWHSWQGLGMSLISPGSVPRWQVRTVETPADPGGWSAWWDLLPPSMGSSLSR